MFIAPNRAVSICICSLLKVPLCSWLVRVWTSVGEMPNCCPMFARFPAKPGLLTRVDEAIAARFPVLGAAGEVGLVEVVVAVSGALGGGVAALGGSDAGPLPGAEG